MSIVFKIICVVSVPVELFQAPVPEWMIFSALLCPLLYFFL